MKRLEPRSGGGAEGTEGPNGANGSLDSLAPGSSGRVASIGGDEAMAVSLMEIGLHPGAQVTVIRRAPMGCPLEVAVGGARFSIRCDTARHVRLARDH